ncbi:MAG: PaaI family thioesterase [Desulfuromonadales bacterium]
MRLLVDQNVPRQPGVAQFELEGWIDCSPFETFLGMTIEQAAHGQALLTMPFNVMLANGGGVMHGGAMTTLADTAVAMAVKSLLSPGTVFATTRLSMEFLAPVLAGQVSAHARVQGPQGRLFHGACELRGEQDQLYARFESVFKVARQQS